VTYFVPLQGENAGLIQHAALPMRNPSYGDRFTCCLLAICNNEPPEDSHPCTRRVLKGGAVVISAAAKLPYIPIALRLGSVAGPIAAFGNSTGFFVLEYWAISATINDLFGAKISGERELVQGDRQNKPNVCKHVAIVSTAAVLALSSQLPTALPGMQYNEARYKIAAGLVLMIAGALIPMRSLQLSIEQIRLQAKKTTESEMTKIQAKMGALVRAHHGVFIGKNLEGKRGFIETLDEIRHMDRAAQAKRYLAVFSQYEPEPVSRVTSTARAVFNYTGLGLGALSAGIFEYALGEYTFEVTKQELCDNDVVGGVFATLAVGSTAYLFGRSLVSTTQRIFNVFGNLVTGGQVRNLSWHLRPKLSFALTAIGLITDICALGPSYVIWGNFYKDNEVEHELFQKTMCASLFLLLFTSTLDIIDDVVTHSITTGTEEERAILRVHREFQKLAALIGKSPIRESIGYLLSLEGQEQDVILGRLGSSTEQLRTYVEGA
jgi:hypothetical protein